MAQTLIARPFTFFPAYNEMRFIVDSTNKNKKAFEYIFQVFPKGGSTPIATYATKPVFGTGYGEIDLSELLSSKVTSEIENAGSTSYFGALNSYYEYDVKIGERFVDPLLYTSALTNNGGFVQVNVTNSYVVGDQIFITQNDSGVANPNVEGYQTITAVGVGFFVINVLFSTVTNANIDGSITYADNRLTTTLAILTYSNNTVFNGVFDPIGINLYDALNYNSSSATDLMLTTLPLDGYKIAISAPLLINVRTNGLSSYAVNFENSDGDKFEVPILGTQDITTFNAGTFNTMSLSVISGTLPLVKPTTLYYDFWLQGVAQSTVKYRVYITKECEITPYSLCYVDRLGSIISLPFTLKAREQNSVNRTTFNKKLVGMVSGQMWRNVINQGGLTQVNSTQMKSIQLASPYVSEEMAQLYFDLIASPSVVLFDGTYIQPVILTETTAELKTQFNDRVMRFDMNVKFSNNNKING